MNFATRLKELRKERKLTQAELAERTGLTVSSISMYENGNRLPELETFEFLADFFNVNMDYLKGKSDTRGIESLFGDFPCCTRIPVYGCVPAGVPKEAISDIVKYEEIPEDWTNGEQEYVGVIIKGDSMEPLYMEGDTVIVRVQPDCECGQDCVVYIDGYDATLKRVIKSEEGFVLFGLFSTLQRVLAHKKSH